MAWAAGGADFHCDTASSLGIATLVWTPRSKAVLTDVIEAARLRDEEPLADWEIRASAWPDPISSPGNGFLSDWPEDCLYECRASLTAPEIERARSLGRDAAEILERVIAHDVRPGMTERHLGGAVAGWLRDRGVFAHVVLVAADERIARYRHPIPTAKPIERCVMVAICAQRHGLIVSATRLVRFGPIDADLARRHEAVCAVDRALHGATRQGARWCDVLAAGIREYGHQGFADEWSKHHQGGPMGYEARDFKATPAETRTVQPDQLVGWNPSITGTKSEDTILVRADGTQEIVTETGGWPLQGGRPAILIRTPAA